MPATRYVEKALAAVRLEDTERAEAAYARSRKALGLARPPRLTGQKADLERKLRPTSKAERGRGSEFHRRIEKRHERYTAEHDSAWATKRIAREEGVEPGTVRVWLHRARRKR
jgi:hypothetical protein